MFTRGFIFVVLCYAASPACSEKIPGISDYCTKPEIVPRYFTIPETCCTSEYACDMYIEAKETKYNMTNRSSWSKRHCACDRSFYQCLHRILSPLDGLRAFRMFSRDECFSEKLCQPKTACQNKYKFENTASILYPDDE